MLGFLFYDSSVGVNLYFGWVLMCVVMVCCVVLGIG